VKGDRFRTLGGRGEAEIRVRSSRFLAVAFRVREEEEAREVLREQGATHFEARHHCGAWRLLDGIWRTVDAGEPSGSAGLPILAAIDTLGVVDAGVVVSRYFGGTKLGIGGLARAYGDAATAALAASPKLVGTPAVRVEIAYDFGYTGAVMLGLERCSAGRLEQGTTEGGFKGVVSATIATNSLDRLRASLTDQTSGAVDLSSTADTVLYRPADF
jgi:putative IMPACT (imprinted ancient) family translation regulator